MKISEYSWVSPALIARVVDYISLQTDIKKLFTTDVEDFFEEAYRNKQVYTYGNGINAISYYKSPYVNKNGEQLWYIMLRNERSLESTFVQKWRGLYIIAESELVDRLLTSENVRLSNLLFKDVAELNTFLCDVADKAMKEPWVSPSYRGYSIKYPILRSYIEYTFAKLQSEYNEDPNSKAFEFYNNHLYFNTGLLDRFFNQIIIKAEVEEVVKTYPGVGEVFIKWYKHPTVHASSDYYISKDFNEDDLPKLATYFTKLEDIVFNANLQVNLNDRHIFADGLERGRIGKYSEEYLRCKNVPDKRKEVEDRIIKDFEVAVSRILKLVKRNYHLAVPQYWAETGTIQFLLPIYLDDQSVQSLSTPHCVLALRYDDSGRVPNYRGTTILTVDMAYQNARLIARPEAKWLAIK